MPRSVAIAEVEPVNIGDPIFEHRRVTIRHRKEVEDAQRMGRAWLDKALTGLPYAVEHYVAYQFATPQERQTTTAPRLNSTTLRQYGDRISEITGILELLMQDPLGFAMRMKAQTSVQPEPYGVLLQFRRPVA